MNRKELNTLLHDLIEAGGPCERDSTLTLENYVGHLRCELINIIDAILDDSEDDDLDLEYSELHDVDDSSDDSDLDDEDDDDADACT